MLLPNSTPLALATTPTSSRKMLVDAHNVSLKGKEGPDRWLHSLHGMSTARSWEELFKLMDGGQKVADCNLSQQGQDIKR
jgi:hypothetical protein